MLSQLFAFHGGFFDLKSIFINEEKSQQKKLEDNINKYNALVQNNLFYSVREFKVYGEYTIEILVYFQDHILSFKYWENLAFSPIKCSVKTCILNNIEKRSHNTFLPTEITQHIKKLEGQVSGENAVRFTLDSDFEEQIFTSLSQKDLRGDYSQVNIEKTKAFIKREIREIVQSII